MTSWTANDLDYKHPLIGTHVTVAANAKPAGWGDDEWADVSDTPQRGTVTEVATGGDGFPFGTVEVLGWYWDWCDIVDFG